MELILAMSSSGGGGGGLSRPVSRSTELLHVSLQDSVTGRRSWDSLVPDKKKGLDSPGTSGPEGVTDDRTRFSMCASSPTTAFGSNSPWFAGQSESRGCDTPTRLLLGCTMPRSILALSERPVTYEEELEERLGLLRVSAKTLYQRLASEKQHGKELAHQLNARELTYRGVIEKMRLQYDQRFDRLKNRARLLVTRCELLRSEKLQLEGRLSQAVQGAVKERQAMERRISSLEDEVERLRSEREEQELPVLKVVEDADIAEEDGTRKAEEEKRKAKDEEEVTEKEKVEKVEEGEKMQKKEEEDKKAEELDDEQDLEAIMRLSEQKTGSANNHYRILCEIAVARVAWLEELLRSTLSGFGAKSLSANSYVRLNTPSSLTRRSSSCPMLVTGSPRRTSNEKEPMSPAGHPEPQIGLDYSSILRPKKGFLTEGLRLTGSDREVIARPKASTIATTRSLTNTQSMPPTIGHPKPARTSTATIRHSLQKLFASGRPNSYDPTSASLTQDGKQPRVSSRIDTPSDDEPTLDLLNLEAKIKRSRRKMKGAGVFEIPMIKAKRTASLPRVELLKKFQTVGRQEREAPTLWYADTFQMNQVPLTKQERLLGVRLDHLPSDNVSSTSGSTAEVQEASTTQLPLTKQERVLGVRLDRSTSDKVSPTPASTPDVQEAPTSQVPLTKQERVLGVRLDRVVSDKASPTSGFVAEVPTTDFSSHVKRESTESLPDKVLDLETGLAEVRSVKRNRSVHSTFGRLHQRRNGVTDIARVEQKATKPQSTLDQFGKNLKQYLH